MAQFAWVQPSPVGYSLQQNYDNLGADVIGYPPCEQPQRAPIQSPPVQPVDGYAEPEDEYP